MVLDNFEDNLTLGGERFLDPGTVRLMQILYQSAQRGKILITCRYPVPDAGDWLASEEPGPLTPAQTAKLMLRLSALRAQEPDGVRLIQRAVGGHPRMLEYLDAILKRGKSARVSDVARRLREQAKRQGLNLEHAGASLDSALQAALQVGAGDILLDELLEQVAQHEAIAKPLTRRPSSRVRRVSRGWRSVSPVASPRSRRRSRMFATPWNASLKLRC